MRGILLNHDHDLGACLLAIKARAMRSCGLISSDDHPPGITLGGVLDIATARATSGDFFLLHYELIAATGECAYRQWPYDA